MNERLNNKAPRRRPPTRRRWRDQRGVALVMTMIIVAVMFTYAISFSYNARINFTIAKNVEEQVIAYFNARSAVQITRLVVGSEKVFMKKFGIFLKAMKPPPKIELWRFAPLVVSFFNSKRLALNGIQFADLKNVDGLGTTKFGSFGLEKHELEDAKANVNRLGLTTKGIRENTYRALRRLFLTKKKELFNDDETRIDALILAMIDWIDPDDNKIGLKTQLDSTIPNQKIEFILSAGYGEDSSYSDQGYKSKDAPFDTLDELRLVDGMTDEIFDAFKDQLTVYQTTNININEADRATMKSLICDYLTSSQEVICPPEQIGVQLVEPPPIDKALTHFDNCRRLKRMFFTPMYSNVKYFRPTFNYLPSDVGVPFHIHGDIEKILTTDSRVLRIVAKGTAKKTKYTIEAIMDLKTVKWVYWREGLGN